MALFEPAYLLERKNEGYYVNNPADKGGETYAGVARNIFPLWDGWSIIDRYKQTVNRPLKTNERLPDSTGIESLVKTFYLSLWSKNGFEAIKNQDVANILYDWFINSGYLAFNTKPVETFGIQEILNTRFNKKIKVDGRPGPETYNAINSVDPNRLYNEIKKERENFYLWLVRQNPTQKVFLSGWLKRLNSFPNLKTIATGAGFIILALIVLTLTLK